MHEAELGPGGSDAAQILVDDMLTCEIAYHTTNLSLQCHGVQRAVYRRGPLGWPASMRDGAPPPPPPDGHCHQTMMSPCAGALPWYRPKNDSNRTRGSAEHALEIACNTSEGKCASDGGGGLFKAGTRVQRMCRLQNVQLSEIFPRLLGPSPGQEAGGTRCKRGKQGGCLCRTPWPCMAALGCGLELSSKYLSSL